MTGLILKDILCLRKVLKSYALIFAIYALLAVAGVWSVSYLVGFIIMMVSMLPFTCFNVDYTAKWETYGLALPVSRNKTVAARYLALLLMMAVGIVVIVAIGMVLLAAGEEIGFVENFAVGGVCLALGVLLNSITIPLIYLFGAERARIVFFGVFFGIGGLVALWLLPLGGLQWLNMLDSTIGGPDGPTVVISTGSPWLAAVSVALVCAALLGVSFLISCAIYKRKEM